MPIICGVRFRDTGKIYYFDPGEFDLKEGDYVIVSTARGEELAQVVEPNREADPSEIIGELKPVVRRATSLDLLEAERYRQKEAEALQICQEQVDRLGLEMKPVSAEYSYDGSRLTIFFTAEKRVDFRDLVRELAHILKTRVELRQIGVRDEARLLGGLGPCGRPLCCATWLTQFIPVSIRMAKQQNLPLSPMEISGICGRLLCCLTFENEYYKEVKGRFPKIGSTIETPLGPAKVVKVSVLKEMVTLLLEDGTKIELTADQLAGEEPIKIGGKVATLKEGTETSPEDVIKQASQAEQDQSRSKQRQAAEKQPLEKAPLKTTPPTKRPKRQRSRSRRARNPKPAASSQAKKKGA